MHSEKEGRGLQIKSALTVSQSPCGGHKKVHIVQWGLSVTCPSPLSVVTLEMRKSPNLRVSSNAAAVMLPFVFSGRLIILRFLILLCLKFLTQHAV